MKKGRMVAGLLVCLLLWGVSVQAEEVTDQTFMEEITLAFMDGVKELTPDNPRTEIQAVMVKAPGERMGSA